MAQITVVYKDFEEMKAVARFILGMGENIPEMESVVQDEVKAEPVETQEVITYTIVDVRAALTSLNKAGKKEQVQELIHSFGAEKLSQIDEKHYAELMKKAGEI